MRNLISRVDVSWWSRQLTPYKRLWFTSFFLMFIISIGSIGYQYIEDLNFADSIYQTIITLSTVGFQEVKPLSDTGRVFTIFLIIVGIGAVGYGFGNVTAFLIEGELKELFKVRKMEKLIEKLQDHIIICGYGNEGRHAGEEIARNNVPFIVIEKNEAVIEKLRSHNVLVIDGDATEDEVLLSAGVATAKGLIAAVTDDSDNVFISLTARGFNPHLTIVARAADETAVAKLFRAGANKVISSAEIGGRRMASMLIRPKVVNFLDVMTHGREETFRLEEIDIDRGSSFDGKSIKEMHIRQNTGTLVIGFHRQGHPPQFNPPADIVLTAGDVLFAMGTDEQIARLQEIASSS